MSVLVSSVFVAHLTPFSQEELLNVSIMAPVLRDVCTVYFCPVILIVLFMQKVFL